MIGRLERSYLGSNPSDPIWQGRAGLGKVQHGELAFSTLKRQK